MKNILVFLLVPAVLTLSACGAKDAVGEVHSLVPPPIVIPAAPAPEEQAPQAAGLNNHREFKVLGAALSADPYVMGMYQLVVYNEKHGSACYGLGDVFVKIPVSKTGVVGRHSLRRDDRTWNAVFTDRSHEYREESGFTEITDLSDTKGHAKLSLGLAGSDNFLFGDIEFENCLK